MRKTPKKTNRAKTEFNLGESMLQGAREALAYARGEKDHGCIVHVPERMEMKYIRLVAGAGFEPAAFRL